MTVIANNLCPAEDNEHSCPGDPNKPNIWGYGYNIDIAIPGGG